MAGEVIVLPGTGVVAETVGVAIIGVEIMLPGTGVITIVVIMAAQLLMVLAQVMVVLRVRAEALIRQLTHILTHHQHQKLQLWNSLLLIHRLLNKYRLCI